jgi:GT2 family glycosyltransferase
LTNGLNPVITASIVLYNTPKSKISRLLILLQDSKILSKIFVIDNSPLPLELNFSKLEKIEYIKSKNVGYGAGNNLAIRRVMDTSDYHIVLNPDTYFDISILDKIYHRFKEADRIGLIMPKVLYPDGRIQYLCKLIPNPVELFFRRFPFPLYNSYFKSMNDKYELKWTGYSKEMNVPVLSGCFMFLNVDALQEVGIFDERYFMYAEDMDLSRRIHERYKTLYYPEVFVYHEYAKSSYSNIRLLFAHVISIIRYFNKWGWFFDPLRKKFNDEFEGHYKH